MLAEVFDAEEIEDLHRHNLLVGMATAFHAPKKLPKHKWRSSDRAGTRPGGTGKKAIAFGLTEMALGISGGTIFKPNIDNRATAILNRAKVTGRRVIYMDTATMEHFTESGIPTKREQTDLIIKMKHGRD